MEVELDLTGSVVENAQEHYRNAKKAAEKLKGAEKALKETEAKISKLRNDESSVKKKTVRKKPEAEKRWHDKFRLFESSDNFLVVGGRDAVTNEILVKKHVDKNDVIFHADVQGAPFFVIKNPEKKTVPEETMRETAEAAASYSSSWKRGIGSCDVYQVMPEQVSKKAESGEYLPKGAFMVRGEKNWFRNMELKLAVGFITGENAVAIGGPVSAVASKTKNYAEVGVGDMKSRELAAEIKKAVLRKTSRGEGVKVKAVPLDEIQKFIPGGQGRVLS